MKKPKTILKGFLKLALRRAVGIEDGLRFTLRRTVLNEKSSCDWLVGCAESSAVISWIHVVFFGW